MKMKWISLNRILGLLFTIHCSLFTSSAQELQVKVSINHSQIQGTDNGVFDNLQQTLEQLDRKSVV